MESGGWSMAPGALRELRLKKAEQALGRGEPELAVVEAEELLDEEPDHVEALLLVGDASLECALPRCAQEAFEHALSLRPDHPRALTGLCIAHFERRQLEDCTTLARRALSIDGDMVEPLYYLGLALERLGRHREAEGALARAASLAPERYPLVSPTLEGDWPGLIERALSRLSPALSRWLEGLPIAHSRLPDMDALDRLAPEASPTVPVLFTGHPPPPSDPPSWHVRPQSALLFWSNIERIAVTERIALEDLLAESLRGEALGWLGPSAGEQPLGGGWS